MGSLKQKVLLIFIFIVSSVFVSPAQNISNVTVTGTPVCPGATVSVNFNANNGALVFYNALTNYSVYLSSVTGGTPYQLLATFTSAAPYSIAPFGITPISTVVTIPIAALPGSVYNISVGSSLPLYDGSTGANASIGFKLSEQAAVSPASSTPVVCVGTLLNSITHTTTGATGIGPSLNLPPGLNAVFSSNTITISGTPNTAGTFNYSIPLTGGCGSVSAAGTITVESNNSVSVASSSPNICIGSSIGSVTHKTTMATGIGVASGLPPGTMASFSSNTITITGTPTATGVFNYSIPLTGGCGMENATGTIRVSAVPTVGPASSSPTICVQTSLPNIIHTVSGVTGIGVASGLPPGISANYLSNAITISGTPTSAGTFNYSIPTTGGCSPVNATGSIVVSPLNTVASPSSTPSLCVGTVLTNITHATTGATGIGTPSTLPPGVTAFFSANTITISGTPTVVGIYNYSIPLTGGCGAITATGSITVIANKTVSPASSMPSVCLNVPMASVTHATTGGTGIGTATGLPAGVTASFASNTITIGGTPTALGTFNYTIPLSGGCGAASATGTITVTPNRTVGAASSTPSLCINTALPNITHATTGVTGISSSTGLPAGVNAIYASNTITLSGTPTGSGTFTYTITPIGCGTAQATGTITVIAANTAGVPSSSPTVCINTVMPNITHATTGATNIATATGLPTGVTTAFASNTITLSGSPSVAGTYNYSIPLTGGCGSVSATGTITVTANRTAGPASATPTLCISTPLTNITHTTTNATGIGVPTNLPAGVNAVFAGNVITLSGTPTTAGIFSYTIPLVGCGTANATGVITVTPNKTVSTASSAPVVCINTPMTNITHATTGGTGVGTATGLPGGIVVGFASNNITLSGTPTTAGTFNYSIPLNGGCGVANATGTITVDPASVGGIVSSAQTICAGSSPADLNLSGQTGSVIRWERSLAIGFGTPVTINVTNTTLTSAEIGNLTATTYFRAVVKSGQCAALPSASVTITVNAAPTIFNITGTNTCQGLSTGTISLSGSQVGFTYQLLDALGNVIQTSKAGTGAILNWTAIAANTYSIRATNNATLCLSFTNNYIVASNAAPPSPSITPSNVTICQGGPATLLTASGLYPNVVISESFANSAPGWQQSNSTDNNTGLQNVNGSGNSGTVDFAISNGYTKTYSGTSYTFQSPTSSQFLLTNHREQTLLTYTTTALYSPSFSTQGMIDATLQFNHTLKLNTEGVSPILPDNALVQVSTVGTAGPWTTIKTYSTTNLAGLTIGATNAFVQESIPLNSAILNQNNVYIRFVYNSKFQGWWWALDDIAISVAPRVNFTWSPTTGLFTNAAGTTPYTGATTSTVYANPGVTSTYIITTDILSANGCPANTNITVNVNTAPAITAQPASASICLGGNYSISASSTGIGSVQQWEVSTNGGTTWGLANGAGYATTTSGTVSTLTVANANVTMVDYLYRLSANAGSPCIGSAKSNIIKLKIKNVWTGGVSVDWQNPANWSDGVPGNLDCDTVHILNRNFKPVLSSGVSSIRNLLIYVGADVTIANQPSTWLAVAGSIVNKNATAAINALNGRLVLNSTTQSQQIAGSLFIQRIVNYLTLSNSAGGASLSNVAGDTLYISNRINFGNVNSTTFTTNGNLSLMSRGATTTASVGDLTNNGTNAMNNISGKVTVERWVNAKKAWRFLSIPTVSAQTFRTSWQENNTANSNAINPGFGTTITGLTIADNWLGAGFDMYSTQGTSVKLYNPDYVTFTGIPNTNSTQINSSRGYMTFIRGNRSATTFNDPASSTILRTSGTLKQGVINITVPAGGFADIGNPYAAPIDMRKVNKVNTQTFFYLWNPNLGGGFGLGAYQTYSFDGTNYVPTPNTGVAQYNFIQSGQAFLVRGGTSSGSITFEESDKDSTDNLLFRTNQRPQIVNANLAIVANNTETMVDGTMIEYGSNWSNTVDSDDAIKMTNTGENVASLGGQAFLAVQRRKSFETNDTILLNISGLRLAEYRWSVSLDNLSAAGRTAYLLDAFLNTRKLLSFDDTTVYDFKVQNIAGSYDQKRFMIVFRQEPGLMVPPVSIKSISASRNYDGTIAVDWQVANETNVQGYTLERSADEITFEKTLYKFRPVNGGGTENYVAQDMGPYTQDNYYRIRGTMLNGESIFSDKVKVSPAVGGISVYPNPVVQKLMKVSFTGMMAGNYQVTLHDQLGQQVHQSRVSLQKFAATIEIRLPGTLTRGIYQLNVTAPSGKNFKQNVLID